jgi:hypothetical protein
MQSDDTPMGRVTLAPHKQVSVSIDRFYQMLWQRPVPQEHRDMDRQMI